MAIIVFLAFTALVAIGAQLVGVDSRDIRRRRDLFGSIAPLR